MLNDSGKDLLFLQARSQFAWLDQPVSDEILRQVYELIKFAPTSANTNPFRVVFVRTPEGKQRLRPALAAANVDKTMAAPVTAILAYDAHFYDQMGKLFPARPEMRERFASSAEMAERLALQGGTLQAAYFFLAARALGLDCGPMGGFDRAKVDAEFFGPGSGMEHWCSHILCNLGYGDASKLYPRLPRLDFEDAARLL